MLKVYQPDFEIFIIVVRVLLKKINISKNVIENIYFGHKWECFSFNSCYKLHYRKWKCGSNNKPTVYNVKLQHIS